MISANVERLGPETCYSLYDKFTKFYEKLYLQQIYIML